MQFPPKKGTKIPAVKVTEHAASSVGNGGIPASLKIKAAGTKDAPGLESTVNLS